MLTSSPIGVADFIDQENQVFIKNAKTQLQDLSQFSTEALEWLMMEHYQFSFANVHFLTDAAERTATFDTDAVSKELIRNCAEENGHAAMYRSALQKVNVDVDTRVEFPSTTRFLGKIDELSNQEPSVVLGTMFATETAAIFEHEVFLAISNEIIKRRHWNETGADLVWFHEMHLGGVEQSHRDELGIFLRGLTIDKTIVAKEDERPTINVKQALVGAEQAIKAMTTWWDDLLAAIKIISTYQRVAA